MQRSLLFSSPTKGMRSSNILLASNLQNYSATDQNDLSYISNVSDFQPKKQVFDAKDYLIDGVTEYDVHIFKQVFDMIDQNGDGYLNPGKIQNAMKKFGNYNAGLTLVYDIVSSFDNNLDGKIDFEEFVKMMKMKPCKQDTVEDIQNIFDEVSNSEEGITVEDLIEFAKKSGDELSEQDAINIIKKFDPEGNSISMKQFIDFNRKCEF